MVKSRLVQRVFVLLFLISSTSAWAGDNSARPRRRWTEDGAGSEAAKERRWARGAGVMAADEPQAKQQMARALVAEQERRDRRSRRQVDVVVSAPEITPAPLVPECVAALARRQQDDGQIQALSAQIQSISLVASSVSQASRQVSQTSQQLAQSVTQLAQSTSRLSQSIQSMQQSAQQAQQSAQQAQQSAQQAQQSASSAISAAQSSASSSAAAAISSNMASITANAAASLSSMMASASASASNLMSAASSQVQAAKADATLARVSGPQTSPLPKLDFADRDARPMPPPRWSRLRAPPCQ